MSGLDISRTARLLRAGLRGRTRPIDQLTSRIEVPGGTAWFEHAIAAASTDGLPLEQLAHLKDRGKTAHGDATLGDDERLAGLALYLVAIASALAHHGTLLTRRDRSEVRDALLELASVAPAPWDELLCRAADAPPTSP